jgi:hypothetical protein
VAETPRIQLAQTISTRDYTMNYDAIMWNYYGTHNSDGRIFCDRRFGLAVFDTVTAGAALGMFAFNTTVLTIVGTTFYVNGIAEGTVDGTSVYQFTLTGIGGTAVFLKNNSKAYTWDGTTLTQVTDANYPAITVPGVAWLDGYVFVETPTGAVYNSNLNTPAVWNALNFITAQTAPDAGVAIARIYNYIVAFGAFSTTFFLDAGNIPPGSPLLPNISAQQLVGCASGTSVVSTENTIFWVGQTQQKGRRVYKMNGLIPTPISDQFIDRVLNSDPLTNVYAYFIEINGHAFYVLTLTASNCTLVYDDVTGTWTRWSSSALLPSRTAVSAVDREGTIFVVLPDHGFENGDIVSVTSSNSGQMFLGDFVVTVLDANVFTYMVGTESSRISGGINTNTINTFVINGEHAFFGAGLGLGSLTIAKYVQNYFSSLFYTYTNNSDYLLDATNGITYVMEQGITSDNGKFIYGYLRTNAGDFGTNNTKFFPCIEIMGDRVSDTAYIGYSDTDFVSYSHFRPINLGATRPMLRRCAAARRRAFVLLYIGGFQVRFYQIELPGMREGTQ